MMNVIIFMVVFGVLAVCPGIVFVGGLMKVVGCGGLISGKLMMWSTGIYVAGKVLQFIGNGMAARNRRLGI